MRQELIDLALLDAPDGWLVQSVHRNAMVRKMQVAALTGLGATVLRNSTHSRALRIFDITDAGIVIRPPDPRIDALLSGQPRSASPVAGTPPGSIEPV